MSWYSNKTATTVIDDGDGYQACIYHQTKVVRWKGEEVTLNSGGFQTATTKTRMNEVSKEYGLGFHVYQTNKQWFVDIRHDGGKLVDTYPFTDGMTLEIPSFDKWREAWKIEKL